MTEYERGIEDAAQLLERAAASLYGTKKRVNQVDLHVVSVLENRAEDIRSLARMDNAARKLRK